MTYGPQMALYKNSALAAKLPKSVRHGKFRRKLIASRVRMVGRGEKEENSC